MHLVRRSQEIEVKTRTAISGHFRLVVSRPDGSVVRTMEFENLVLDAGLNRLGTDAGVTFCAIGTGTATPTAAQTTLQSQSQSTSDALTGSATDSGGASPYWTGWTFVFRFAIGSLGGNYSEIGVGWSSTLMYARALILDVGLSPTTITVGAGEQLDVYYTRRLYPPLSDVVTTPTIGGVSTTVTTRAHTAGGSTFWNPQNWPRYDRGVSAEGTYCEAYNGALGALTAAPSGASGTPSSATNVAYSNNSYSRTVNVTFALGEGNLAGGITATVCWFRMTAFKYGFSPAIAKTSAQTLAMVYSTTWARRP